MEVIQGVSYIQENIEGAGTVQPGKKKVPWHLISVCKYLMWRVKKTETGFFVGVLSKDKRQMGID